VWSWIDSDPDVYGWQGDFLEARRDAITIARWQEKGAHETERN
jgi:hypothetical protein